MFLLLFLIGAFVFCHPIVANSEPAVVRSGEHGNFTRLVIQNQALGDWTHTHKDNEHQILFETYQGGFDTTAVFSRINRKRVSSVFAGKATINIKLACSCEVNSFSMKGGFLVIDVKDASNDYFPFEPASAARLIPHFMGGGRELQFGIFADLPDQENQENLLSTKIQSDVEIGALLPIREDENSLEKQQAKFNTHSDPASISEFQSSLISEFGTASSYGLLEPSIENRSDLPGPRISKMAFDDIENFAAADISNENVSILSSVVKTTSPSKKVLKNHAHCLEESRFDIASWSDGRSFDQQIGDAKEKLFSPLGKLEIEAAIALARLFLHFGFGAEAKQVAKMDQRIVNDWPEILAIADIFEVRPENSIQFFSQFSNCDGRSAFWSALTDGPATTPLIIANQKSILFQLSSLPFHLRQFFAPLFSDRFLSAGNQNAAQEAMGVLKRNSIPLNNQAELQVGQIAFSKGQMSNANNAFSKINPNSEAAVQALIQQVKPKLDSGQEIDEISLNLIGGYVVEYYGLPIGQELQKIEIVALAAAGQYLPALDKSNYIPSDEQRTVLGKVHEIIADKSSDLEFLTLTFDEIDHKELPTDTLFKFSKRLNELGFPAKANDFLNSLGEDDMTPKHKILNAEISLSLGNANGALRLLDGVFGTKADIIRAQVYASIGENKRAYELLGDTEETELEAQNAWLSQEWAAIVGKNNGIQSLASGIANAEIAKVSSDEGMLGQIKEILDESRTSRDVIERLISDSQAAAN